MINHFCLIQINLEGQRSFLSAIIFVWKRTPSFSKVTYSCWSQFNCEKMRGCLFVWHENLPNCTGKCTICNFNTFCSELLEKQCFYTSLCNSILLALTAFNWMYSNLSSGLRNDHFCLRSFLSANELQRFGLRTPKQSFLSAIIYVCGVCRWILNSHVITTISHVTYI